MSRTTLSPTSWIVPSSPPSSTRTRPACAREFSSIHRVWNWSEATKRATSSPMALLIPAAIGAASWPVNGESGKRLPRSPSTCAVVSTFAMTASVTALVSASCTSGVETSGPTVSM